MKDITITASRLRKELILFIVCFLAAFGLNVYSIAKFDTDWSEMLGQLHVVFAIAIVIYLLLALFRLIFLGFSKLSQKK